MSCHIRYSHDHSHFLWCHACFRLNVAGLPRPVGESSSHESLEELENPSEDESWIALLFTRARTAHAAILQINFAHTNERSTIVMLKPFDWINVLLHAKLCSKIAQSTPVLGYNPSGGERGSYLWAPAHGLYWGINIRAEESYIVVSRLVGGHFDSVKR